MMLALPDRVAQAAQAVVDRIAFAAESAAVAIAVIVFMGLAAARFDVLAAAVVWGDFWRRFGEVDGAARAPVAVVLFAVVLIVTIVAAFVRWPKARRAFAPFPYALPSTNEEARDAC